MLSKTKYDKLAEKPITELTTVEFQTAVIESILEANAAERERRSGEFIEFALLSIVFAVVAVILVVMISPSVTVIAVLLYWIYFQYWMYTKWL